MQISVSPITRKTVTYLLYWDILKVKGGVTNLYRGSAAINWSVLGTRDVWSWNVSWLVLLCSTKSVFTCHLCRVLPSSPTET